VGIEGRVVGIDMTPEMVSKARETAKTLGLTNAEFREGLAEALPIADGWADVVISNGAINLCTDKQAVFAEIRRVLRPGGNAAVRRHREQPRHLIRGTARHRPLGRLNRRRAARAGWQKMLEDSGFGDVVIGPAVDVFGGTAGEDQARAFEVFGYAFLAVSQAGLTSSPCASAPRSQRGRTGHYDQRRKTRLR